jgi:hypothetical protein
MHRVPLKLLSIILAVLLVNNLATAQLNSLEDIESIGKKGFFKNFFDFGDPFQLGGGIGLNLRSYSAKGTHCVKIHFLYGLCQCQYPGLPAGYSVFDDSDRQEYNLFLSEHFRLKANTEG